MTQSIAEWFQPTRACVLIAEIGVNHNGDLDMARRLIDVAVEAGADAVKFQTFSAENLVTGHAEKAQYQQDNDPRAETQGEMLRRLEFAADKLVICRDHCRERDIVFLSTPFDEAATDLLMEVGVEGFKVSSGDLTNLPLLAHMAAKELPMIISTGMADLGEIEEAVDAIQRSGDPPLGILHCVSDYPAKPEEANLKAMQTIASAFGKPVGWSDHTLGDAVTLAAVALGARFIEKHFTLDRTLPGPDHAASLEPDELKAMIEKVRIVEASLGEPIKRPQPSELETAKVARKSIVAARDLKKGETIKADALVCKRPGTGLAPRFLPLIIGRRAARSISADTLIDLEDIN